MVGADIALVFARESAIVGVTQIIGKIPDHARLKRSVGNSCFMSRVIRAKKAKALESGNRFSRQPTHRPSRVGKQGRLANRMLDH